jgi:hypothetical protein
MPARITTTASMSSSEATKVTARGRRGLVVGIVVVCT